MKNFLAFLLAIVLAVPALAQKPPINAVAGPTTSAQFGSIITNPFGSPSTGDRSLFVTPHASCVIVTDASLNPLCSTSLPSGIVAPNISSGVTGAIGFTNGHVVGVSGGTTTDFGVSGTGTTVALTNSPAFTTPNIGAAVGTDVNLQSALTGTFEGASFQPDLYGWGGSAGGQTWTTSFNPAFGVMQNTLAYNETELQIYTNLANGIATRVSGTNQVTYTSGTAFDTSFAESGLCNFYLDGTAYIVLTASSTTVTVKNCNGTAVSWGSNAAGTYFYGGLKAENTCTVAGGVNATTSPGNGTPFFGLSTPATALLVDHVLQPSWTYNSNSSATLGSAVADGTHTCTEYGVLDDQIAKVALQGLQGANEEAFVMSLHPDGVQLGMQYSGAGQYRSIKIWDGEFPAGTKQTWVDIEPNATLGSSGTMSLGGLKGSEGILIDPGSTAITSNWATALKATDNTFGSSETAYVVLRGNSSGFPAIGVAGTGTGYLVHSTLGSGSHLFNTDNGGSPNGGVTQFEAAHTAGANRHIIVTGSNGGNSTISTSAGGITITSALTLSSALTYGGVTLSNSVTGTGSMALSASPTFTGTVGAADLTATGTLRANTGLSANGSAGLSVTKTVRASGGASDCTLIYTFGLLTGGSC